VSDDWTGIGSLIWLGSMVAVVIATDGLRRRRQLFLWWGAATLILLFVLLTYPGIALHEP
jgi:hypothetical protein